MNLSEFERSIAQGRLPEELPVAVQALWHDARGDWEQAHQCAQDDGSAAGAWVHAYLHRKEGDLGNAAYWYRRAGQPTSTLSFPAEWRLIATELLGRTIL